MTRAEVDPRLLAREVNRLLRLSAGGRVKALERAQAALMRHPTKRARAVVAAFSALTTAKLHDVDLARLRPTR